jgi:ABC-type tungstate transport system substrate-binding protein
MKVKDFVFNTVTVSSILVFMLLPVLTTIGFILAIPDFNMSYLLSESVQQFMNAR